MENTQQQKGRKVLHGGNVLHGRNVLHGGKVITSGGFGCIFEPELQCEGDLNSDKLTNNKLTKLMTEKHAKDEYQQIQVYKDLLSVIPNYSDYFLLNNFSLCKPAKLTKRDLIGFPKKCKALKKKGITAKNINKSLDKLMAINMPNGGIDVDHFIKHYFTQSNFILLNNSLIDLLVHGILPMNNLNVYHCDIKDSNILVNVTETRLETRLIDWGLSFVIDDSIGNGIPRKIYRRPFQYNVPFSSVLFNKEFTTLYLSFLKINPNPEMFQIREFIINYIFIWNDIRGAGHLSAINEIVKKLTKYELPAIKETKVKNHVIEYEFTYHYIVEYLSAILEKYTNNGELNLIQYFHTVFLKNIDVWGFTMMYVNFYERFFPFFEVLNTAQVDFLLKIKHIIIHYLFESPTKLVDVSSLVNELTNLNKVIEHVGFDKLVEKGGSKRKKRTLKKTRKRRKT